jgi:two-component system, chemotaxis family, sensor kinase CheA
VDASIVEEFVLESSSALETIETDLLALEKKHDAALLGKVFRALHSIKGAASFLDLTVIEKLGHQVETLLDLMRQGKRSATAPAIDALLKAVDKLRQLIAAADLGAGANIDAVFNGLSPFIQGEGELSQSSMGSKVLTAAQVGEISKSVLNDRTIDVAVPTREERLQSTDFEVDLLPASMAPHVSENPVLPVAPVLLPPMPPVVVAAPPPRPLPPPPPPPLPPMEKAAAEPAGDDTMMRVRVRFLDELLQLTGNMVMARNQLLSNYNFADDPAFATLSQCVTEVHKTVVRTRIQPISSLFARCERLVRDLCRQLGKEVNLEVRGRDLELDRSVIETFADPLNHLLRNAVDHGVESPAARLQAGKSRAGKLVLSAAQQAGDIILSIEDDGGGIDPQKVSQSAVRKGLLSADEAARLNPREAIDLIFRPGFSTRDEVTNLSGRGVGLDVVRTNLEKLGGVVDVKSAIGHGTTFSARLPLTTALVSSSLIAAPS